MKKIKSFSLMFLMISLMFLIPMELGVVFAEGTESNVPDKKSEAENSVTKDVLGEVCGANLFNVRESLILSTIMLCLPGILDKMQEYQEYGCEEVVCKYNYIKSGLDPTICTKQRQYKNCKMIFGELYGIGLLGKLEDLVKTILSNPAGLAFAVAAVFGRKYLQTNCPSPTTCTGPIMIGIGIPLFLVDIAAAFQTLQGIAENGFQGFDSGENYCEQMRDLKGELEEIVKAYDTLEGGSLE